MILLGIAIKNQDLFSSIHTYMWNTCHCLYVKHEKASVEKSFADIVREHKKEMEKNRLVNNENKKAEETPIFMMSDKTATELFEEVSSIVGLKNVSPADIRKYLWSGESLKVENLS